jgi:hypothetical protein
MHSISALESLSLLLFIPTMSLFRLFLLLPFVALAFAAQAGHGPKPLTIAQNESRNEAAAPSFSAQIHESERITSFLTDALMLSNLQQHAVQSFTLAKHKALLLAVSATDVAQAQQEYHAAIQKVLATSQLVSCATLCRRQNGTMLPLDGVEIAAR